MIGLPLAAANLALGAYQAYQGYQGLKNLKKQPVPQYAISPELQKSYNRAEEMSSMGYTPQETAAFKQNVAQQQNTGFRQGVNMAGGNLAQALQVGLGAQKLGSFNQFAGADAALHRQNIRYADTLGSQMSQQRNLITGNQIQRRNMLEQAYGGAFRSGLTNMANSFNLTQAMGGGTKLPSVQGLFGGQQSPQATAADGDAALQKDFALGGDFYNPQPAEEDLGTDAERAAALDRQYNQ